MSEFLAPNDGSTSATAPKPQVMGVPEYRPDDHGGSTSERAGVVSQHPCERAGCPNRFPRSPGPGRPRRFCGDACRRADRRGPGPLRSGAAPVGLARILVEAIARAGLTLTDICERLEDEDGVSLARTTLHNWCTGTRPQRRPELLAQLHALERVLSLSRGTLVLQLEPGRPAAVPMAVGIEPPAAPSAQIRTLRRQVGRLGGVDGYLTKRVREQCAVAVDRHGHTRRVQQTVLATGEHTDCYWLFASADHADEAVKLTGLRDCRLGRTIRHGRILALELLFDTTLRRGEEHTFGFRLTMSPGSSQVQFIRRWTSPPGQPTLDHFELEVSFATPPRRVLECDWPTETGAPHDRRSVPLDGGAAMLTLDHPAPALVGLRWEW